MRFIRFSDQGEEGLAVVDRGTPRGLLISDRQFPGTLDALVRKGGDALTAAAEVLRKGAVIDPNEISCLPPFIAAAKLICVGLNYADHSAESGFKTPDYPTLFCRFNSSLIGHGAPMVRPTISDTLDYEGELVAVIGKPGRNIAKAAALSHVAGYSIFNDGSVREYQFKAPQWTVGKNFDGTGAFGPVFVTADELPDGCRGLKLETRLNGETVQSASTDDLVFDVASLIAIISEAITLEAGDVIVTGTPSGVGHARTPRLYMRPGDICEVEIEGIGILSNKIVAEEEVLHAVA
jgi:acylpyruvate hydrolase